MKLTALVARRQILQKLAHDVRLVIRANVLIQFECLHPVCAGFVSVSVAGVQEIPIRPRLGKPT